MSQTPAQRQFQGMQFALTAADKSLAAIDHERISDGNLDHLVRAVDHLANVLHGLMALLTEVGP